MLIQVGSVDTVSREKLGSIAMLGEVARDIGRIIEVRRVKGRELLYVFGRAGGGAYSGRER